MVRSRTTTLAQAIVPSTKLEGIRNAKNFTLRFTINNNLWTYIVFALVYLPEGFDLASQKLILNTSEHLHHFTNRIKVSSFRAEPPFEGFKKII